MIHLEFYLLDFILHPYLIIMSDVDTLWRRCREMEAKENFAEAFKTALYLQKVDTKNEEVITTLRRLNARIQKMNEEQNSTENRVRSMLKYLLEGESIDVPVVAQQVTEMFAPGVGRRRRAAPQTAD